MQKFTILVGVIPIHQDNILITQRSFKTKFLPGNWGLPCGKIEFGEDVEDAVHRELLEETGLSGDIVRFVGTLKFMGVKEGVELHNLQINYLVKVYSTDVILDDSSEDYKWIKIENFEISEVDDFNKNVLRQAFPNKC